MKYLNKLTNLLLMIAVYSAPAIVYAGGPGFKDDVKTWNSSGDDNGDDDNSNNNNNVEASPVGVVCGINNDEFRQVIPQGYKFYKKIGITSMNILDKEISILDDYHAMARIHWQSIYDRKDEQTGDIDFDVIYFVQDLGKGLKIFAYITGDEQKALKDNALI